MSKRTRDDPSARAHRFIAAAEQIEREGLENAIRDALRGETAITAEDALFIGSFLADAEPMLVQLLRQRAALDYVQRSRSRDRR